jgi:cation:H+ antiporter
VGDITGGNMFDGLFVAAADVALRSGWVYHALDGRSALLAGLTVVLTAPLAVDMIQ